MEEVERRARTYPPGYRFVPTDVELIREFLVKKVENQPLQSDNIKDIILYENNPMDLAERYPEVGYKERYFFSPRKRKYPNGKRPDRAGNNGYWKPTGNDIPINYEAQIIGFKKVLVYYQFNSPKDTKTNWIMHEYRLNVDEEEREAGDVLDEWVVCKIRKNNKPARRSRSRSRDDVGSDPTCNYDTNFDPYLDQVMSTPSYVDPFTSTTTLSDTYDTNFDPYLDQVMSKRRRPN